MQKFLCCDQPIELQPLFLQVSLKFLRDSRTRKPPTSRNQFISSLCACLVSSGLVQSLVISSKPCKKISTGSHMSEYWSNWHKAPSQFDSCPQSASKPSISTSQELSLCMNMARINETVDRQAVGHNHPLLYRVCYQDNSVGVRYLVQSKKTLEAKATNKLGCVWRNTFHATFTSLGFSKSQV